MKFFLQGIFIVVVLIGLLTLVVSQFFIFTQEYLIAVGVGGGLALLYVSGGFLSYYFARKKKKKKFNRFMLAGFFIRLLLIAILIITTLKFIPINKPMFLISMFVCYFMFQILEVIGFNKLAIEGN